MSFEPGDKVVCIRGGRGHLRVVKGEVYTVKYVVEVAGLVSLEGNGGRLWKENRFERMT